MNGHILHTNVKNYFQTILHQIQDIQVNYRYKIYPNYKILYVNEDNIIYSYIGKYIDLLITIFSEILMITGIAKNINEPVGRNIKIYSKHKRFFIV